MTVQKINQSYHEVEIVLKVVLRFNRYGKEMGTQKHFCGN
jgi:hypothetical protein